MAARPAGSHSREMVSRGGLGAGLPSACTARAWLGKGGSSRASLAQAPGTGHWGYAGTRRPEYGACSCRESSINVSTGSIRE